MQGVVKSFLGVLLYMYLNELKTSSSDLNLREGNAYTENILKQFFIQVRLDNTLSLNRLIRCKEGLYYLALVHFRISSSDACKVSISPLSADLFKFWNLGF